MNAITAPASSGRVLLLVFLALALMLGGLALHVAQQGQVVRADVDALANRDLAALSHINHLKTDFLGLTLALQRLYARADLAELDADLALRRSRLQANLAAVAQDCPVCPEVAEAEVRLHVLDARSSALRTVMTKTPVDWDEARHHLYAADASALAADAEIDRLALRIEQRVEASRAQVEATTRRVAWQVLLIALVIGILAAFFGYYTWRHLVQARTRRQLARFPERNPLPVFSLSLQGEVRYANPAAKALAVTLLGPAAGPERLLPKQAQGAMDEGQGSWEYPLAEAILHCELRCMSDLGLCHAYVRDITAQRRAEERLRHQALHDAVTGLPNQRAFQNRLENALARGEGALLLLHLDRYHGVIESLGHAAGERLLRALAERLAVLTGDDEQASSLHRFEGELFGILLQSSDATTELTCFSERVAEAMHTPMQLEERTLFFTLSQGGALFPRDGVNPATLLRHADTALHQVIKAGGNGFRCYRPEMDARALDLLEMEHALRHVELRGELELHYQPQAELESGRIIGVEALVRWRHPNQGLISPADFIPLAEQSGAIVAMGKWILETACSRCRAWQIQGLPPVVMAVNLSPRQFLDSNLPDLVARTLERTGLDPAWLELEVTESAAMHDVEQAAAILTAFKRLGVRVAIDDFGTGHSSLAYLSRFPIDKLKIDQSFVRAMDQTPGNHAIVRSIIGLGSGLGLTVIAEGVENRAQWTLLQEYGCHEAQGYLLSRPLPDAALMEFLAINN